MRDAIQRQKLERRLALLLAAVFLLLTWLVHLFVQQSGHARAGTPSSAAATESQP
jgi:hypothetical protein